MVAPGPKVEKQIPDELIILQLLSIFGDQFHIKPDTQTCSMCERDLPINKFGGDKYSADGRSRVCGRCEHIIAISALV